MFKMSKICPKCPRCSPDKSQRSQIWSSVTNSQRDLRVCYINKQTDSRVASHPQPFWPREVNQPVSKRHLPGQQCCMLPWTMRHTQDLLNADLLKEIFFARSELTFIKFGAETAIQNIYDLVKLCQIVPKI